MPHLKITVSGRPGSGKSTFATMLAKELRSQGVSVSHDPGPDGPIILPTCITAPQRFHNLVQSGLSVEIEEVQIVRAES